MTASTRRVGRGDARNSLTKALLGSAGLGGLLVATPVAAQQNSSSSSPAAISSSVTSSQAADSQDVAKTTSAPQSADTVSVADIVVTAQRRSERLQDVPLSIQAFSSDLINKSGATTTADLAAITPGLVFTTQANAATPFLRGVGSNLFDPSSESPVAIYVDDVYIAAPETGIFALNNIKQVEVLKGPQGTLFGRNATGGVIRVQTLDPAQEAHLDLAATYANYDTVSVSGYGTVGLTPDLASDLSFLYENQGKGYGRNLVDGRPTFKQAIDNYSLRNKWLFEPGPDTTIRLAGDYAHLVNTNAYQKPQGTTSLITGAGYPGRFNSEASIDDRNTVDTGGVSLRVDQRVAGVDLVSISAYRKSKIHFILDEDITAAPAVDINLYQNVSNVSQEVQLKNHGESRFQWILGGFYYDAKAGYENIVISNAVLIPFDQQKTESIAGFGQATLTVFKATNLTAGLRYTDEKQRFTLPAAGLTLNQKFNKLTYRFSIDQHFTPDILGYVSYNRGFKSGGFNLLLPGNTFKPETLDATEVGVKTVLFDRKLRINVAGFYYDYKDLQQSIAVIGGVSVFNAAQAHIKGLDMDASFTPIRDLSINAGLSLLHGRYVKFPDYAAQDSTGAAAPPASAAGKTTIATPNLIANLSVVYARETSVGKFEPSISMQYNDGFFFDVANRLRQPSYVLINAGLGWTPPTSRFGVRVWIKNLLDERYYNVRQTVVFPIGDAQREAAPRTYGLTLSAHL